MDRDTFTETIRAFKHRLPFRPFTVVTVSGNRHDDEPSNPVKPNSTIRWPLCKRRQFHEEV